MKGGRNHFAWITLPCEKWKNQLITDRVCLRSGDGFLKESDRERRVKEAILERC